MNIDQVKSLVERAATYCPSDDQEAGLIISYFHNEGYFLYEGEETGNQYEVKYKDVLDTDSFYELVLLKAE